MFHFYLLLIFPMDTMDLSDEEEDWLKFVWTKAKLIKPKQTKLVMQYSSKSEMLNRMKVLLGETDAGNDNPALLQEMELLANKLAVKGYITPVYLASVKKLVAMG